MEESEYKFKNYLVVEFVKKNSVNLITACWIVPNMTVIRLYGALEAGLITTDSSDVVGNDLTSVEQNELDDIINRADLEEHVSRALHCYLRPRLRGVNQSSSR